MSNQIVILVATHKDYIMPKDRELYMPIQVGCDETNQRFGFQQDNIGENISFKHKYYSDLSSIYWGWKNLTSEYIGSCQYRRYFVKKSLNKKEIRYFRHILETKDLERYLENHKVLVSKKRHYFIETIESHYGHTHEKKDFDLLRESIKNLFPEYLNSFEKVAKSKSAHMFNAFVMQKEYFNNYCEFVFSVLFDVEKKVDFLGRSEFDSRVCGYLAEFLLDTWLIQNKIQYNECAFKLLDSGKTLKKIIAFLKAKFLGKKYEKSF